MALLDAAPRRRVRQGRHARGAAAGDPHLRAHARAVAALSSRAQDRRIDARARARAERDRDHRADGDPSASADHRRGRADRRRAVLSIRLALCAGDPGHRRVLHVVHLCRDRVAHLDPAAHERQRQRRQHQGDRLAAQLRNGQVFRGGGARDQALRPLDGALRARERQLLRVAERAQCRPGGDLHHRARDDHGDVRLRRPAGHQHRRRFRHDQRHDDPALPAAQLHGHGLSRDQAGDDRHRDHVQHPAEACGDRRPAGRQAARGPCRRHPLRERQLRLRAGAADPQGRHVRGAGRQDRGDRRALGRGQVDDLAAAVSLLRRHLGPHPDRRPGCSRRDAAFAPRRHRHGAAGHRAVQRHHPLQHPLRPLGGDRRRGRGGRAAGADRRLHPDVAAWL